MEAGKENNHATPQNTQGIYLHLPVIIDLIIVKPFNPSTMIKMYGILNRNDEHIDVSNTLHGAKCYATRNGYKKISLRHGYNVVREWEKADNKWIQK